MRPAWLALLALASCTADRPPVEELPSDAGASPNASLQPAPRASEPPPVDVDAGAAGRQPEGLALDSAGRLVIPDGGLPPPEPLRAEGPLPTDPLPANATATGVTLQVELRWADVPAPPKGATVSADGVRAGKERTTHKWSVDLSDAGRMRLELSSSAFLLPLRTELRSRLERWGHVLVWPNQTDYRVLPLGALRSLLGERRADVMPLGSGPSKAAGDAKRLGTAVKKHEVKSPLGTLKLEVAKWTDAGEGASLWCRVLLELGGVDPKSPLCQSNELVLHAEYAWKVGGSIAIDVVNVVKRTDMPAGEFLLPPPGGGFNRSGLPGTAGNVFLTREEVAALRTGPTPALGPVKDPKAPGEGFLAKNRADVPLYVLLDGVPVVDVPSGAERFVIGTTRSEYVVQWRSFLGEIVTPPVVVALPALLQHPKPADGADAGPPDGG